jgi:hypothetical protein
MWVVPANSPHLSPHDLVGVTDDPWFETRADLCTTGNMGKLMFKLLQNVSEMGAKQDVGCIEDILAQ